MAIVTTLASIGPLLEAKYAAILPGLQRSTGPDALL